MKIAILGSMRKDVALPEISKLPEVKALPPDRKDEASISKLFAEKKEEFDDACRDIGRALVERGHTFILTTKNEDTADPHIILGAGKSQKEVLVQVFFPEAQDEAKPNDFALQKGVQILANKSIPSNVKINKKTVPGSFVASHVKVLKEADAVIVIGGASGAEIAIYNALVLDKPLLLIPTFLGSSARLFTHLRTHLEGTLRNAKVSPEEIKLIFEEWDGPRSAEAVASAIEKVAKFKRSSLSSTTAKLTTSAIVVVLALGLIGAWFALLTGQIVISTKPEIYYVTMLLLSTLMGVVMRTGLTLSEDKGTLPHPSVLMSQAGTGALIAFTLLVLCYFGVQVISGASPEMQSNVVDRKGTIFVTLLGLASGFTLDKAAEKVNQTLGGLFSKAA